MNKRYLYSLLILLLLTDLAYSFLQHYSMPLDGDMAGGIIPAEDVNLILKDPFGISVITDNAIYSNPNRFFAHWTFFNYFNYFPIWLQNFVTPIESIYLACAIAKICIQVSILALLAFYITGKIKILDADFLIVTALITPLFQTNGYRYTMGIIDPSITYTFFYALPCALLLLFYLPFFNDTINKTSILKIKLIKFALLLLSIIIVFNGPLNSGVILIISLLFGINYLFKTIKSSSISKNSAQTFSHLVPINQLVIIIFISILSLYALYIGKNNAIFLGETISMSERYSRIPKGIISVLTQNIGFEMLLIAIGVNLFILKTKFNNSDTNKTLCLFFWIGIFSILYILLLPLGGYKEYRPNILRYDTIMPITIAIFYIYGKSSHQLIKKLKGNSKMIYLALLILISYKFSIADQPEINDNKHEKLALEKISKSKDKVVFIDDDCSIVSWRKITNPLESKSIGVLLKKWGVTNDNKEFYQNK